MLTLNLRANVIERIEEALKSAGRHEIGGVLFGEHIGLNEFRIVDLTVHKRGAWASFLRSIEEALNAIHSFFARTNHNYTKFNYIGEWHSHPSFKLEPSPVDDASMLDIVVDPKVGGNFVVLLLVKLDERGQFMASAHVYLPDGTKHGCSLIYECSTSELAR